MWALPPPPSVLIQPHLFYYHQPPSFHVHGRIWSTVSIQKEMDVAKSGPTGRQNDKHRSRLKVRIQLKRPSLVNEKRQNQDGTRKWILPIIVF